jgi:hypothetical protein
MASRFSKLLHLTSQITDNPIDLLDHRFCQDFCFRADLDVRHGTPRNKAAFLCDRHSRRHQLTKGPVASAGDFTDRLICQIYHPPMFSHAIKELIGYTQAD